MKALFKDWTGIEVWGIDRLLILIFLVICFFKYKSILKSWLPFILFWLLYDSSRGLADNFGTIHVKEIYDLELRLFGWLCDGEIPAVWAQRHQNQTLTIVFSLFYSLHILAPFTLGVLLFIKSRQAADFKVFTRSILLTSYLALLTFIVYPVAPPWYVWNGGNGPLFDAPTERNVGALSAGGLINLDDFLGHDLIASIFQMANYNRYAALPSLHAAYAFLVGYFAIRRWGKRAVWMVVYPAGVFLATIYLNHHYIVDLLLGILYAVFATWAVVYFSVPNPVPFSPKSQHNVSV